MKDIDTAGKGAYLMRWYVWVNNQIHGTLVAKTHNEACRYVESLYGRDADYQVYRVSSPV